MDAGVSNGIEDDGTFVVEMKIPFTKVVIGLPCSVYADGEYIHLRFTN